MKAYSICKKNNNVVKSVYFLLECAISKIICCRPREIGPYKISRPVYSTSCFIRTMRTNRMQFISIINLYMFLGGLLFIIRIYYSVYTAIGICHTFMLPGRIGMELLHPDRASCWFLWYGYITVNKTLKDVFHVDRYNKKFIAAIRQKHIFRFCARLQFFTRTIQELNRFSRQFKA